MTETLIFVGVAQWVIGFGTAALYFTARETRRLTDLEAERDALWDRLHGLKPCRDRNSNVCVAEGCYGEACVTAPPARDAYGNPVFSAQFATAPKSPHVRRDRTRNPRSER